MRKGKGGREREEKEGKRQTKCFKFCKNLGKIGRNCVSFNSFKRFKNKIKTTGNDVCYKKKKKKKKKKLEKKNMNIFFFWKYPLREEGASPNI